MNTSAPEPETIWRASTFDAARFKVTRILCCFSAAAAISWSASVRAHRGGHLHVGRLALPKSPCPERQELGASIRFQSIYNALRGDYVTTYTGVQWAARHAARGGQHDSA